MKTSRIFRPGQKIPSSAQVEIVGPRGGRTGVERTVVKDKTFPPTPQSGQGYLIVDRTKNKSGK